jgi:hypothetical protein
MGKKWTDKEDNVLVTMREAGTSYREIASIMGRTAQSCQQRIFKLGKSKPQTKPKMVQEVTPVANLYQEASYPLDLDYTFLKPKPTLLERIIHKLFRR